MNKALITLVLCLMSSTLYADTHIVFQNSSADTDDTSRMMISNNRMRMNTGQDSQDGYLLFDADKNEMIFVNTKQRSYMVFDDETMQKIAGAMQQAKQQMESQLSQLPPAQRKQMEQMMSSMLPDFMTADSIEFSYNRTGSDTVAGFDCDVLEVTANGKKASELCVADPDELDIPASDAAVFLAMRDFQMQMIEKMPFARDMVNSMGEPGSDQLPIRYAFSNPLTGEMRGSLVSVSHEPVNKSDLTVPDGYKQEKMEELDNMRF